MNKIDSFKPRIFGSGLGFSAVLVLMIIVFVIDFSQMAAVREDIELILEQQHRKAELVSDMRFAIQQRQVLLRNLALAEDPFERDEEGMRFHRYALVFAAARRKLDTFTLSDGELVTLEHLNSLTAKSYQAQNELVDHLLADDPDARKRVHEGIQRQDDIMAVLNRLMSLTKESSRSSLDDALELTDRARWFKSSIGLLATVLALLIAVYVSRRTRMQTEVVEEERYKYKVLFEAHLDAVLLFNEQGIKDCNPRALALFELCSVRDAQMLNFMERSEDVQADGVIASEAWKKHIDGVARSGGRHFEWVFHRSDGQPFHVEVLLTGIVLNGENLFQVVMRDITERKKLESRMLFQATHDSLTGLINRREFEQRLEDLLQNARLNHSQHTLCYIDLDQFKVVNDTCGHTAGDKLLQEVTALLQQRIRGSDTLARLGGDEFAVLMANCPLAIAQEIAETLCSSVKQYRFRWENQIFVIGASIGIAPITADSGSVSEILSVADSACYVAKDRGRNRIHVGQQKDVAVANQKGDMRWVNRIQCALEENRLCLFSQLVAPVSNSNREIHMNEVLLRMIDEQGRLIPATAFIPSAERYDLMPTLDRWVVRKVVSLLGERDNGLLDADSCLSINLSAQSINDDGFLSFVVDEIDRSGINPERLCIEVEEITAVSNLARAARFFSVLHGMGCKLTLDNFGSGLSSFAYLNELHIDYLKIDSHLVSNMITSSLYKSIVDSVNRIGQELGVKIIAISVETESTLELLADIGVEYVQGNIVESPRPLFRISENIESDVQSDKGALQAYTP